jgi:hypothetical protein
MGGGIHLVGVSAMEDPVRGCPYCGSNLVLVNVIQRFGERPEIRILQCTGCDKPQFCTNGNQAGGSR